MCIRKLRIQMTIFFIDQLQCREQTSTLIFVVFQRTDILKPYSVIRGVNIDPDPSTFVVRKVNINRISISI